MTELEDGLSNLSLATEDDGQNSSSAGVPPPPPPPLPASNSNASFSATSNGHGPAPPPPPPGPGANPTMTYKQQKEQNFQEQQMANLPSGLMTTAMKADKKPFSYTPVGLTATDLKSPSVLRQEKLEAVAAGDASASSIIPGIPRGPTHYRVFNGITPASPTFGGSASSEATGSSYSPSLLRRSNSGANSVASDDDHPHVRARPSGNVGGSGTPIQSRSFRILQWMTGADQDDDAPAPPPVSQVEPDQMRFSGYNQPAEIPSRAFKALDRMTNSPQAQTPNSVYGRPPSPSPYGRQQQQRVGTPEPAPFRTEFSEDEGANLRYGGSGIPSRSFQMLQNMTDNGTVVSSGNPGTHTRHAPAMYNQNGPPSPSLLQNLYGAPPSPTVHSIASPNPMDFKYGGPQYSTYELPNPRTPAANSTAARYSSTVNFTPTNSNANYYGQQQPQPQYGNQGQTPYGGVNYGQQTYQQPPTPSYYGGGAVPHRNFQYSQVPTGQGSGHGISDF